MTEIAGTVTQVKRMWYIKINTKPVRKHMYDGAIFPHWVFVRYEVDGRTYVKRKYCSAYDHPPQVGRQVTVLADPRKPRKAKILL